MSPEAPDAHTHVVVRVWPVAVIGAVLCFSASSSAGAALAVSPAMTLPHRAAVSHRGAVTVPITCLPQTLDFCKGRFWIIPEGAVPVDIRRGRCACGALGQHGFTFWSGGHVTLKVTLTRAAMARLVRARGTLSTTAIASVVDGSRSAHWRQIKSSLTLRVVEDTP
jgi:hypothetical protein